MVPVLCLFGPYFTVRCPKRNYELEQCNCVTGKHWRVHENSLFWICLVGAKLAYRLCIVLLMVVLVIQTKHWLPAAVLFAHSIEYNLKHCLI